MITTLLLQRLTHEQILKIAKAKLPDHKISARTLRRDVSKIKEEWIKKADKGGHRARELAELDDMEREIIRDWQSSAEIIIEDRVIPDGVGGVVVRKVERRGPRDPRYLDRRLRIKERRAKLMGLDAPARQDVTLSLNMERLDDELERMSDEELMMLAGGGDRVRVIDVTDATPILSSSPHHSSTMAPPGGVGGGEDAGDD